MFTVLFYSLWSTSVEHERFRVSRELELVGYEVQSILMEDERYFLIRGKNVRRKTGINAAADFLARHPEVLAVMKENDTPFNFRATKDSTTNVKDSTMAEILWPLIKRDTALARRSATRFARSSKPLKFGSQFYFAAFIPIRRSGITSSPIILLYSADNILGEALRRHPVEGCEASLFSLSGERMHRPVFPALRRFSVFKKLFPVTKEFSAPIFTRIICFGTLSEFLRE